MADVRRCWETLTHGGNFSASAHAPLKADDDGGTSSCAAGDQSALDGCLAKAAAGCVLSMQLTAAIACVGAERKHAWMDLTAQRPLPLMVSGATSGAGLHRTNFSQPLLQVSGDSRLVLRRLIFEDAMCEIWLFFHPRSAVLFGLILWWNVVDRWPSCYPKSQPLYRTVSMVSIGGASGLVVENCTFLRGHKIGVGFTGNTGLVFSRNLWLESQTFGIWTGAGPHNMDYSPTRWP